MATFSPTIYLPLGGPSEPKLLILTPGPQGAEINLPIKFLPAGSASHSVVIWIN